MSNIKRVELKAERLARRKKRVRGSIISHVDGAGRPRLSVHRTLKHIYAQIIDDTQGVTVVSASSLDADVKAQVGKNGGNKTGAAIIGEAIGKKAIAKGLTKVVFDRSGLKYHGRVKELADAARKAGLQF